MAALLVASSLNKKLVYDEPDNLAYGHRFLAQGPSAEMRGQRMPVLALNALGCVAEGCHLKVLDTSELRRLAVRLPTMAFTLALGLLVYRWAGELFGRAGGAPRPRALRVPAHVPRPRQAGDERRAGRPSS